MARRSVLFLCTGNSCRSQMAEGWLRQLGGARYEAVSAGIEPQGLNPLAVQVMAETGVAIAGHRSKSIAEFLGRDLDLLVTVCGGVKESCPMFTGIVGVRRHWPLQDPAEATGTADEVLEAFRRVRDEIRRRVAELVSEGD